MICATQRHAIARASDRKAISAFWAKAEKHNAEKLTAAKAILQDIAKYQGEQSAVVIWARMIVRRSSEQAAV